MPTKDVQLILASQSPRRRELLEEAGYSFEVVVPSETAECGICSRETPPELVGRLAYQKAADVACRTPQGLILGCDTVAECHGQILGKPYDRKHARQMLRLLRGRVHHVYSGVCLWHRPSNRTLVKVDVTKLKMEPLTDGEIESYLDSQAWQGKAGAFGLQDRLGWIQIVTGSSSNVVGLPLELLAHMLEEFAHN